MTEKELLAQALRDYPTFGHAYLAARAEAQTLRDALEQAVIATNGECPLCAPLNKWGHTPSCPLASALATPDTPPDAR